MTTKGEEIAKKWVGLGERQVQLAADINAALHEKDATIALFEGALQKIVKRRKTYNGLPCKDEAADIAEEALQETMPCTP